MEDLGSFWNYQESFDELKLKLQYSAMELESVKMEAAKTNSSITESNSLSDTYNNHHSHASSPVDSLFDAVTSPAFPTTKMPDSSGMGLLKKPFGCLSTKVADAETTVIDNLAKGKTLPEKGKLLQAVMEAGPLLSTLLVAGPLPQWRNPPPSDTFRIPPASIKGSDNQKPVANPNNCVVQKRLSSSLCPEMSRWTHQMCSSAMLSFTSSGPASGLSHSPMVSSDAGVNTQITVTKRQRFL
ncbi:hypothetical protein HRI_004559600 [Hibiscus trionum]|uniref:Uncharacterized protein n=1 Tax=Hibiscus trionum TaxID=183268 RepID=A0A9W7MNM0_HIBTR|nr:hypothetical protein HRI_004559600 [Hibiscus trionum]